MDVGESGAGEEQRSGARAPSETSFDVVIVTKELLERTIARVSIDRSSAPVGSAGSLVVRSNDKSTVSTIRIVTQEARLRTSRDRIITRVGAGTQAMLSLRNGEGKDTLANEQITLYNEGQAPLHIRDVTIHDVDWASVHTTQEGLTFKDRTIPPMSPPDSLDIIVRIDGSARRSAHNLKGTICISSNDPRPDILIPIEASRHFVILLCG